VSETTERADSKPSTGQQALERPRDRVELASALEGQLAGMNVPRSTLSHMLELLEEQGFLSFDLPIEAADQAKILRAIERAGFRVMRRTSGV
jgi:methylase of polypeptide subunit release factors